MADVKVAYGASAELTNAIASLAASATWVNGYESAVLDNTTNKNLDYLVSGRVTVGTSATAGIIEVWAVAILDDTTWWSPFDGTTGSVSSVNRDILMSAGRLVAAITTAAGSDVAYFYGPVSLASLFGGVVPKKVVFYTTHSTGVALNATAGNHKLWYTPVAQTVV